MMRDEAYPCGAENSVYSDEKLERYAMKKAFQNDDDMTVLNDTREATVQGQVARLTTTSRSFASSSPQRSERASEGAFSKGERTSKPRRPGRKPGKGNFS